MNPRTVSARDLETMAHAAHERVELPGPEGGWATATINGRMYRARVAPATVAEVAASWAAPEVRHRLIGSVCTCGEWWAQCGNDIPGDWALHVRTAEGRTP